MSVQVRSIAEESIDNHLLCEYVRDRKRGRIGSTALTEVALRTHRAAAEAAAEEEEEEEEGEEDEEEEELGWRRRRPH